MKTSVKIFLPKLSASLRFETEYLPQPSAGQELQMALNDQENEERYADDMVRHNTLFNYNVATIIEDEEDFGHSHKEDDSED